MCVTQHFALDIFSAQVNGNLFMVPGDPDPRKNPETGAIMAPGQSALQSGGRIGAGGFPTTELRGDI